MLSQVLTGVKNHKNQLYKVMTDFETHLEKIQNVPLKKEMEEVDEIKPKKMKTSTDLIDCIFNDENTCQYQKIDAKSL